MATPAIPKPEEDGGLAALQRQLKEQGEEVGRLKQAVKSQPQPQQQQHNQAPSKDDIEKLFWKDPLPMMDAIAKRAAFETEQRVLSSTIDTQVEIARDKVKQSDPDFFEKYEVEIDQMVAQVQPQFRGNINVWQNAVKMVKGAHIDEIIAEKSKKEGAVNKTAHDGPANPSMKAPPASKDKPLTDDQRTVAKGMHLSDEEYRRGQRRYERQDEEWAKVVTFSSEDKRRADANTKRKSA